MVTNSVQKPIKCLLFDMDMITVVKRFWIIEKFNSAEISLILCPIRLSIFKMIYHLWNQNLNWKLHDAQGDVGWYELGYGIEGSTKNENLVQSVGIAMFVIVLWVARKTAHVFPAPKFFFNHITYDNQSTKLMRIYQRAPDISFKSSAVIDYFCSNPTLQFCWTNIRSSLRRYL